MPGYRINERNSGHTTLEGEPKRRKSKKMTEDEREVIRLAMNRLHELMEYEAPYWHTKDGSCLTMTEDDYGIFLSALSKL